MSDTMSGGSIVIPAHNEGTVIERTLRTLVDGLEGFGAPEAAGIGDVSVVVACNGCSDDTAARAGAFAGVTVLDLPAAGKTGALRAAERVAGAMPRIYLDADIDLTGRAATAVLAALRGGAVAARPPIHFDTSASSWLVRRYCAAKLRIPSVMAELCGGGAYGLSAEARSRFGDYPDLTGDDLFIARIVGPAEVTIVETDPLVVRMPRDARSMLKILRRSVRGNQEFARVMPDLARDTAGDTGAGLKQQLRNPRTAPDALVYAAFAVAARLSVKYGRDRGHWERDDSTR